MYKKYTQRIGIPQRLYRKIWLIMRLTTIILLITLIQVSAATKAQQVTLKKENASLKSIFAEIKKQTGYMVLYPSALVNKAKSVTVDLNNAPLKNALDKILAGQGLESEIQDKTIVIRERISNHPINTKDASAANINVQGRVVDENQKPLPGVTIKVKGRNQASISDVNGYFEIKNVGENEVLVFTSIGFVPKELPANKNLENVQLILSNSKLDEIQVIAYGKSSQRLSTSNVTIIKSSEIEKQPVNNPLQALEGQVPGLYIAQANGIPGGAMKVRIQGQNSITSGNEPFYVIDGVPYSSQMPPSVVGGGVLGTNENPNYGSGNPLSYINANDIESISILKDADATAIYGSRAANGAILITTKKGRVGAVKFGLNGQQGIGSVSRKLDMLSTSQYLQMRKEAIKNSKSSIGTGDYDLNGLWDTTRFTNWQKELIGGTSTYTNINTSLSGGTDEIQYLFGSTYYNEASVFPGDFRDRKLSVHFSLNGLSKDKKFQWQFVASYLNDDNRLPTDPTGNALTIAPNAPAIYNSDGTLNWQQNSSGRSSWNNPLLYILNKYKNNTNNLISNLSWSYNISKNLNFKTSFGYTSLNTTELKTTPYEATPPERRTPTTRFANYSNSYANTWIVEPQMNYRENLWLGKLDVLVGSTFQQNKVNGLAWFGSGYNSDAQLEDPKSATTLTIDNSNASTYKYAALFGRVNYNINDKYIFNYTMRRDGSSRFGPGNRFNTFNAFGAAWLFSEESWFKNNLPYISLAKVRGSYGTTGNDQIADYSYLSLYEPYTVDIPYQNSVSLIAVGLNNQFLRWEKTNKLQLGFDFGLFNDRVTGGISYVRNQSSNQLIEYALPSITGFGSVTQNFGATIQNKSWEFILSGYPIKHTDFSWFSSVNLTLPKNKLLSFPGLEASTLSNLLVVGQPLGIQKVYHYLGVNDQTGLYEFEGADGKPTSNPSENDRKVYVNPSQLFYGGFQNTIIFKSLEIGFLVQFVKQNALNYYEYGANTYPGNKLKNQPVSVLNRWQKPGDQTEIQRFGIDSDVSNAFASLTSSDAGFRDASFIRLKNININYSFHGRLLQRLGLSQLSMFMSGQNLLTFTTYKNIDPETTNAGGLPTLKLLTGGLKLIL